MKKGRLIRSLNYELPSFQHSFSKLGDAVRKEAKRTLGDLTLIDIDNPPAKLHVRALTGITVTSVLDPNRKVKVYTVHPTRSDTHKASFTLKMDACICALVERTTRSTRTHSIVPISQLSSSSCPVILFGSSTTDFGSPR